MKRATIFGVFLFVFLLLWTPFSNAENDDFIYADQNTFLEDMARGLDSRLQYSDTKPSDMSFEETIAFYKQCVSCELEEIEKYDDQVFSDVKFNEFAHLYIDACQIQFFATENPRNIDFFNNLWDGAYRCRCGIILTMYERYDLPITAAQADGYRVVQISSATEKSNSTPKPTATPTPKPTATPKPVPTTTRKPATPKPTAASKNKTKEQLAANCIEACLDMAKDPSSIHIHGIKYFTLDDHYVFVMDVTGKNSFGGVDRQTMAFHVKPETGHVEYDSITSAIDYDMFVGFGVNVDEAWKLVN